LVGRGTGSFSLGAQNGVTANGVAGLRNRGADEAGIGMSGQQSSGYNMSDQQSGFGH
jgi:hypothetical protein